MADRKKARLARIVAVLAFGASVGASAQAAQYSEADRKFAIKLEQAIKAQDCRAALKVIKPYLASEKAKPAPLALASYEIGAQCANETKQAALAEQWAIEGTKSPDASDDLWFLRLYLQSGSSRPADVVRTIEAMNEGRGATINKLRLPFLYALLNKLDRAELKDEKNRLLTILASSSYTPEELLETPDDFRSRYATILKEKGDLAGAKSLIAEISTIDVLIDLTADPESRRLLPQPFDERAITERQLATTRQAIALNDKKLKPLIVTAGLLRKLGRHQEALAILQSATKGEGSPESYADAEEYLNWWWDSLSRTHMMLGNVDAALEDLRHGSASTENGDVNVSQTINLSQIYISLNRPADALAALPRAITDKMQSSPFGEMQIRMARGCGAARTGQAALARADLSFAKAHEDDAPNALLALLLCNDDRDGAAAALIARLDDPKKRVEALTYLIDYDEPPLPMSQDPGHLALKALVAREDVATAIARAGGRTRIRLIDTRW